MRVPQVRFKGFSDEWEEKEFSCLLTVQSGRDYKHLSCGNVPVYGTGGYMLSVNKALSEKDDAIGIGRKGTIDKPYILYAPFWTVDTLFYAVPFKKEYLFFLFCIFQKIDWKQKDESTGVPSLSKENINSILCFSTSITEQTKIGNFFKNIDKAIALEEQKYTKLMQMKKALLEKMFPKEGAQVPEIRFHGFSGEWDKNLMGNCVLIQRGGSPRPIDSYLTDNKDGINWIKIGDVKPNSRYITSTKEKIIPSGEKYSRKVRKGDLILSNSMSFGRPYIMMIEGCIHDGWLLLHDEKELFDAEYLLQLLSTQYMYLQYKSLASGGVVNNLNCELVKATTIIIPEKAEQTKIGNLFKTLDKRLTLQQAKIAKLQNVKKALLEKMFV